MRADQISEIVLLILGSFLLIAGAVRFIAMGGWRRAFALPLLKPIGLTAPDVILAVCLFLLTGSFVLRAASSILPRGESIAPAATSPAPTGPDGGDGTAPDSSELAVRAFADLIAKSILIGLFVSIVYFRLGRAGWADWGLNLSGLPRYCLWAVLVYLAFWPICAGLLMISTTILEWRGWGGEIREHSAILTLQDERTATNVVVMTALGAIVFAPIVEELLFRGLIFRSLQAYYKSTWPAALVSGLLFGMIHVGSPQTVVPLVFFGILLAAAYARTGSLAFTILIHAVFNAKTVIWLLLGTRA
ncbi:MAG: CPBP family intramembrane metalloprotease [Phycisphaerae bacterium]|nr:CPBP family intramembrane metalloprotease [Phycisphaerae bacterium]